MSDGMDTCDVCYTSLDTYEKLLIMTNVEEFKETIPLSGRYCFSCAEKMLNDMDDNTFIYFCRNYVVHGNSAYQFQKLIIKKLLKFCDFI